VKKVAKNSVDRRGFLKGAAAGAAAVVAPRAAPAQTTQPAEPTPPNTVPAMSKAAETQTPPYLEVMTEDRPGADYMVDVIKKLGFEYFSANPGSAYRGLHESIINYGGNKDPEFIMCCHEESAVGIAHGYSKIEGKPMGVFLHGTVGVQHAMMAIYNAYCDRVPVYIIAGNVLNSAARRPKVEGPHSAQDLAAMVRDFVKWDDMPASLQHFGETAVRAYKITMTPPHMPVFIVADGELQEEGAKGYSTIPKYPELAPPAGDSSAVAELAKYLVAAENPVILADRCARTPEGLRLLIELAETLQAPVIDGWARLNFPTQHPLNHSANARPFIRNADVILGLELTDLWGMVNEYFDQQVRHSDRIAKPTAKVITITAMDLWAKGNFQDDQRFPNVDLAIAADAEATLPSLIEAVNQLITPDHKRAFEARGAKLAVAKQQLMERTRVAASYAWDASPVSTARMAMELYAQIKNEDWSLVSETGFISEWPMKLWDMKKPYHYIGQQGGYGIGYGAPASVGAALANRKHGRLTVAFQNDGDLMYGNGVLWTAAHHKIPLLSVVHNNRAYHQERMHIERMALRHQRGITRCNIGTALIEPNINYAKLAEGLGVHSEGPITDPNDLAAAYQRALNVVRGGNPALVEVVTQPR
jgi:acetolactate synthase I/II/III large subunit